MVQYVAILRADGGTSVMAFTVQGRGQDLPKNAVWLDEKRATWYREPTDAAIDAEVRKADFGAAVVSWQRIDQAEIPLDRTFRDALKFEAGKATHDMPKARDVVLARVREKRDRDLQAKDIEWMKALAQKKDKEADDIEAERQALRDLPATLAPQLAACTTVEELKAFLPAG